MENFVTDFNVATNLTIYVLLALIIVVLVVAFAIKVDSKVENLKSEYKIDDKTDKEDYPKEFVQKYKKLDKTNTIQFSIIIIAIIATMIFLACKPYNTHVNDLKENYNIEINDNQVAFKIKEPNIYMENSKTFNALKIDNKYILSDVKKPYKQYELTETEFIDLFTNINKPANSIDINKELQEKGVRG